MNPATLLPSNDLAVLLVGEPGSRKTTLALQFPAPYIFDADTNAAAPLAFLAKSDPTLPSKVFFDRANFDSDGTPIPPQTRYAHMVKCLTLAHDDPAIRTIIIDSLTAVVDIVIDECKRLGGVSPNSPMRIQDWGVFGAIMKNLVTKLRTATNKIIVFTAHNKVDKDEADGFYKTFLNIPGQTATNISGLFTDVWNLYPAITGIGAAQTHTWKIRCLPLSANDHRGIKSSMGFRVTETWDTVLTKIKTLES